MKTERRARIGELAQSIEERGLLHPITVTEDGALIAGQRRLEAFRKLGRDRIPARVAFDLPDAVERLKIERDENTARKPMTPGELVSLGKALEALEAPKARGRQGTRNDLTEHGVHANTRSKTREVVAEAIGMSPTSYYRAKTVVEAAEDPTAPPERREVARAD